MHSRNFFVFVLAVLIAFVSPLALKAVDIEPNVLPVSFSFKYGYNGTALMGIYDGVTSWIGYDYGAAIESPVGVAYMKPGKTYQMYFQGSDVSEYWVSLIAPSGYQFYINGIPQDLVHKNTGGQFADYYNVEIRPITGAGFLDAGVFTGIDIGQAVTWELGLGGLRSGHSVGRVGFREPDLTNNPAGRDRLLYVPPINTWQVNAIYDGSSSHSLRQIAAPRKVLDFVDDPSGGYWIKYYNYDDTDFTGGLYVPKSGTSPWRQIRVESPVSGQLKITETEGAAVRVSKLTLTSQQAVASGGAMTTDGTYTLHTFNSSGTLTVNTSASVETLVVAGGGGGGGGLLNVMNGGGGGGGGVIYNAAFSISPGSYPITVGAGGISGTNGGNSVFSSLTAFGGGHGAHAAYAAAGGSGGSGGGEGTAQGGGAGSGFSGQGNNGANGASAPNYEGGGGGGSATGGNSFYGGYAQQFSISGSALNYGGGGGGGTNGAVGGPSLGNSTGGNGGGSSSPQGGNGAPNTGGGGGGAAQWSSVGGTGGSGIVMVRYPANQTGTVASGTYSWKLEEGDGTTVLRTTTHTSVKTGITRENVVTVYTGDVNGPVVSQIKYVYHNYAWGEDLYQIIANPNGGNDALTTTYDYYEVAPTAGSEDQRGSFRRVKSVTGPTGAWTAYEYYDDWNRRGQIKRQYQPFQDAPAAPSLDPALGRVQSFDYVADPTGRFRRSASQQTRIGNVLTAQTLLTYDNSADTGTARIKVDTQSYSDASNYITTHSESIDPLSGSIDESGEPCVVKNADLTQTSWSRAGGDYNSSTHAFAVSTAVPPTTFYWRELKVNGTSGPAGAEAQTTYDGQSFDSVYLIPNQSTIDIMVRDVAGYVLRSETRIYSGSNAWSAPVVYADSAYNLNCRLVSMTASNGTTTQYTYANGYLSDTIAGDGTETQFTYDALGRVLTQTKKGVPSSGSYAAQADLSTTATYDGAGHVTQTQTTGGTLTLTSSAAYDLAGRPTSSTVPGPPATTTVPAGYTTSYAYSADHRFVTVTQPGGGTTITEKYSDGQVRQIAGTAQVPAFFSYGAEAGTGRMISQQNVNGSTTRWINTYTDWLGRKVQESTPDINGNFVSHLWHYNNVGHLDRSSAPGQADTLYLYDSLGSLIRSGLYIDGTGGQLSPASNDRIVDHAWIFFNNGGNWWRRETASGYATAGAGTLSLLSKVETQLTGFTANGGAGFLRLSRTDSYDPDGNVTTSFTEVNPTNKIATAGTLTPGSATPAVQTSYNGLLESEQSTLGTMTSYGYDALGRPVTAKDPRGNLTTTAYRAGSSEVEKVYDGLASAALAGNPAVQPTATYHYDAAGRPDIVTDALGKNARCDYNDRGQKIHEWGDNVSPVEHVYNVYAQQTELHTFRGGNGWTGAAWPTAATGTVDVTTWTYQDTTTGLMRTKTGAGPDAPVITYDFTAAGQLHTRTGARGIVTTYTYSGSTGEVTAVTYSDGTPSVSYQYTRLGQLSTAGDATGIHTFNYTAAAPWQLANETLPAFFGSRQLTALYEPNGSSSWEGQAITGVTGRLAGFDLGVAGNQSRDLRQVYYTSTLGQMVGMGSNGAPDIVYAYNSANRGLVAGYTVAGTNFSVSRSYEPNRDSLATIQANWGGTTLTRFDYATNALGQRVTAKQSGTAFADYYANQSYNSIYTNYRYNDRGELESSALYRGSPVANTTPAAADELPGHRFEYRYDSIGNRVTSGATGLAASGDDTYTPNALNQYAKRDNNYLTVSGTAAPAANVAVQGAAAVRRLDNTWSATVASPATAVKDMLAIYAAIPGTSGAADIVTQIFSPYFAPPVAQIFGYDLDGNLTSDGVWTYTYDAENRLSTMQQAVAPINAGTISAASARRLVFVYDYQGRRVEKQVFGGWNTATQSYTTVVSDTKFIYEGWNLLAELDGSAANLTRSYAWGLDVTGSTTAAGGVGALLQIMHYSGGVPSAVYYPTYDGNGNVTSLVNATTGNLSAVYEYDPYGNYLRAEAIDTAVSDNPFRFSTKYADLETGLVYYGNRYYSAALGRFINKDPIEESGGVNLYGFCKNNGVNGWDYLGQHPSLQDFIAAYGGDVDTAKLMYGQREELGWDYHYNAHGPWDAIASSPFSGNDQMNAQMYGGGMMDRATSFMGNPNIMGGTDDKGNYNGGDAGSSGGQSKTYTGTDGKTYVVTNDPGSVPDGANVVFHGTAAQAAANALTAAVNLAVYVAATAPNSVESIGGGGGGTSTMSGVSAAGAAKLLAEYGKYLKPIQLYGTPGEAFISGALRAATMTDSEYDTNEYTWGVVKNAGGKFYSTFPTTDHSDHFAMVTNNPGIMKAYDNGTLVLIGHNHPPGPMPGELSGYGHGGFLDRGRGDQMVTATYHVPIVAIDPWGYSHAGTAFNDNVSIPGIDLSGANFNNMVTIMRGR